MGRKFYCKVGEGYVVATAQLAPFPL